MELFLIDVGRCYLNLIAILSQIYFSLTTIYSLIVKRVSWKSWIRASKIQLQVHPHPWKHSEYPSFMPSFQKSMPQEVCCGDRWRIDYYVRIILTLWPFPSSIFLPENFCLLLTPNSLCEIVGDGWEGLLYLINL